MTITTVLNTHQRATQSSRRMGQWLWLLVSSALLLAACSQDSEPTTEDNHHRQPVSIDMAFAHAYATLPTDTIVTRAMGDPGPVETFLLPQHVYVFLCYDDGTSTHISSCYYAAGAADWYKEREAASGDSIYHFAPLGNPTLGSKLSVPTTGITASRIYAVAAMTAISELDNLTGKDESQISESQISELTINLAPGAYTTSDYLRNLYSTPANHLQGLKNPNTEKAAIDVMLYHVGARLDLQWNVDETRRGDTRLDHLRLSGLKQKGCLLFRPMANTAAGSDPYTEDYDLSVGEQWNGRTVLYVIPYFTGGSTAYPVSLRLTNAANSQSRDYALSIPQSETYPASDGAEPIYAPWMRMLLHITHPITE